MIILPLIGRELRLRARSQTVYWTRFAVALAAALLCLPLATYSPRPPGSFSSVYPGASQAMIGHSIFTGIVTSAFVLSCCAGLLTVDRISRERREGTLGLLYLTGVKALDVLLGSFGAAGITCVCALVSLLPVIMLPVLAGGVTGGEAFRTMLVLLDTLLLSLAAGLWASSRARGWFKSARSAVLLLLLILVFPVFPGHPPYVDVVSPVAAFGWAGDAAYRVSATSYWMSLGIAQGISWLLLIEAGFRLRRAMREPDGMGEDLGKAGRRALVARSPVGEEETERGRVFTLVAWKIKLQKFADTDDPMRWLVARQRGMKAVVWAGTLIGLTGQWELVLLFYLSRSSAITSAFSWTVGLVPTILEGCLFGWAASRFFAEARRSGELELLLTSPVGAKTIVSSQWNHLKRLFLWPVIILVAPNLVYESLLVARFFPYGFFGGWNYRFYVAISQCLGAVNIILGIGALVWAGLWFGLQARSQAAALVWIVLLCKGVPYVMLRIGSFLVNLLVLSNFTTRLLFSVSSRTFWTWWSLLPQVAVLFYYLWLIRWARRRLATDLTNPCPPDVELVEFISRVRLRLNSLVNKARNWPPTPGA